jgi:hypothetical protein
MKLKKFDLEKVIHGAKVVTRGGDEVTQLSKFETDSDYCLYGVVNGIVEDWTIDGKYRLETSECSKDLFIVGKVNRVWANVYHDTENDYLLIGNQAKSLEIAKKIAKSDYSSSTVKYIKTIEITDEV